MLTPISLAGLVLPNPLMNAAGTCITLEEVKALCGTKIAAIVVGSITIEPRENKPERDYRYSGPRSLNTKGLLNPGAAYYKQVLPEMVQAAHDAGKFLITSIAGTTPEAFAILAELVFESGADGAELNLSCPSLFRHGDIICFNPTFTYKIIAAVNSQVGPERRVFVKVSPYSNPRELESMAEVTLSQLRVIKAVTTTNTFPKSLIFDDLGNPVIDTGESFTGQSDSYLKPVGLGQVYQFRKALPELVEMDVIGGGGISSGFDITDYLKAGATAVQIGTAIFERGYSIIDTILEEFDASSEHKVALAV